MTSHFGKNESTIITKLKNSFTPLLEGNMIGIGDDAALLDHLLITQDLLLEGVHFSLDYFTPRAVAHKALHANLSDIAAMGGTPKHLLLGLSVPNKITVAWVDDFLTNLTNLCMDYQLTLIGGDTTTSMHDLVISITLIGYPGLFLKTRDAAKMEDIICVTGHLGDSGAGLIAHQKQLLGFDELKHKHCFPEARLAEGEWLAQQSSVHAMMDLSDGLWLDLEKLCTASGVGALIDMSTLPISKALNEFSKATAQTPQQLAIQGGEDYELLVTVAQKDFDSLQQHYQQRFNKSLIAIGHTTCDPLIRYQIAGKDCPLHIQPFEHFSSRACP